MRPYYLRDGDGCFVNGWLGLMAKSEDKEQGSGDYLERQRGFQTRVTVLNAADENNDANRAKYAGKQAVIHHCIGREVRL